MTWPTVALGEVAEIVGGGTPKTGEPSYWGGGVVWATPKDLSDQATREISRTARTITADGLRASGATVLPAGSVLLSSRAPIGLVAINGVPMATNQGFKSLIPTAGVLDAAYLASWLAANTQRLQHNGSGATFKEISKAVVERIELPLPPLDEQRRIARVLHATDDLRAKRRAGIERLGCLCESTFVEIFGDPRTQNGSTHVGRVGDLLESATYGSSAKAGSEGSYPVLRMGNITVDGRVDTGDLKFMELDEQETERYLVRRGDVLFNRTNSRELVGKTAVVRCDEPMAYAGYLIRLRMRDGFSAEYLSGFMNLRYTKQTLRSMCKSIVGMANINARELQAMSIVIPALEAQQQFERAVAAIEREFTSQTAHLAHLDALFASLQHRAFAGEL